MAAGSDANSVDYRMLSPTRSMITSAARKYEELEQMHLREFRRINI